MGLCFFVGAVGTTGLPIISSVQGTQPAKLIDCSGRVLAQTSRWQQLLVNDVNQSRTLFHTDGQADKLVQIQAQYGDKIRVESLDEEHLFVLECIPHIGDALSLSDVMSAFELVTYRQYIQQCTSAQLEACRG